jgi:hypothetical protein
MDAVPKDRQRHLIALSQAPWFVGMLHHELRRRAFEERVGADAAAAIREEIGKLAPVLQENRDAVKELALDQRNYFRQLMKVGATIVSLLQSLVGSAQMMNSPDPRPHYEEFEQHVPTSPARRNRDPEPGDAHRESRM